MIKQRPTISLFIPTFDREYYLDQALQSVANQTLKPFEVYVLDNASTDNTPTIVKKYEKYGIRYIRNKKNIGSIRNWIKGFSLAKGEYVAMLASDDMIAPNWCEEWTKVLKKHKHEFYTSPVIGIDQNNKPTTYTRPPFKKSRLIKQPHVIREFWKRNSTGVQTSGLNIYHTKTFRNGPPYDIEEGFATDGRASAEIYLTHDIYYHCQYLCVIRVHPEQTFEKKRAKKSVDEDLEVTKVHYKILNDVYKKKFNSSKSMRYFIQKPVLQYLAAANLAILKGNIERTIKTYKLTLQLFPGLLHNFDDWIVFLQAHWHLFKMALSSQNMPPSIIKEFVWLKDIKQPHHYV